jgi:hypothetical protein
MMPVKASQAFGYMADFSKLAFRSDGGFSWGYPAGQASEDFLLKRKSAPLHAAIIHGEGRSPAYEFFQIRP